MKDNIKYFIADVLNEIDNEFITEAAFPKKKQKKLNWKQMGAIAACFIITIFAIRPLIEYAILKDDTIKMEMVEESIVPKFSYGVEIVRINQPPNSIEERESESSLVTWLEPEEIFAKDTHIFRGIISEMNYYKSTGGYESYFTVISVEVTDVYRGDMTRQNRYKIYLPILPGIMMNSIAGDLDKLEVGSEAIFMPYIAAEESGIGSGNSFFSYADVADYYFSEGMRFLFLSTDKGVSYESDLYNIPSANNNVTLDDVAEYIKDMISNGVKP